MRANNLRSGARPRASLESRCDPPGRLDRSLLWTRYLSNSHNVTVTPSTCTDNRLKRSNPFGSTTYQRRRFRQIALSLIKWIGLTRHCKNCVRRPVKKRNGSVSNSRAARVWLRAGPSRSCSPTGPRALLRSTLTAPPSAKMLPPRNCFGELPLLQVALPQKPLNYGIEK